IAFSSISIAAPNCRRRTPFQNSSISASRDEAIEYTTLMRIYFLRHGETDWNVARRIQGRTDIALNSNGVKQATLWRPFFERISLAGVFSLSLFRSMETAVLATRRPPCVIDELNERNYGEWEGRVWNDIADHEPDFDLRWRRAD